MEGRQQKGHPAVLNLASSWPAKSSCHFLSVLYIGKPNKNGTSGGVVGCCDRE